MRRTLILMAGTTLFFAIATLPVASLGRDHVHSMWAAGLASLFAVAAGSTASRWSLGWFPDGPSTSLLIGPVVRLLLALASVLVLPRWVGVPTRTYGVWLIATYLAILFAESIFLAFEQDT